MTRKAINTLTILSDDSNSAVLLALRQAVEALGVREPQSACRAQTERGTTFVTFVNGEVKKEGAPPALDNGRSVADLCRITLEAIEAYRYRSVIGPARLTWRDPPSVEASSDGGKFVRCRLAFEACSATGDLPPPPFVIVGEWTDTEGMNGLRLHPYGAEAWSTSILGQQVIFPNKAAAVADMNGATIAVEQYLESLMAGGSGEGASGSCVEITEPPETYTPPRNGDLVLVKCDCTCGSGNCPQGKIGSAACFVWMDVKSVDESKYRTMRR